MNTASRQSGFSLIELLIAAMIFTFVMVGVSQLFTQALDLQRRATGYQKIQENALFVLESIAREVRVSAVTSGNTDCVGDITDATELIVEHPIYQTVTYRYITSGERGYITRETSGEAGGPQPISSDDVDFTNFAFCISGKEDGDDRQARITIPMTIESVSGRQSTKVSVSLQTTIVSRDLVEELTN
jgi:prepilin-type N-terminal cleavage/methylation domain-containing protein